MLIHKTVFNSILYIVAGQDDSSSLASQVTSTDSGVWSESGATFNHVGLKPLDINHNGLGVKGHYRDNSYGGSSGYGSVNSQNGGARPKLVAVNAEAGPKVVLFCGRSTFVK